MSNENTPKDEEPQNKTSMGVKIALFAGVLGLVVGAGLYAVFGGNDKSDQLAGNCQYDKNLRKKLDTAATGHVAAFRALDRAYSVSQLPFKNAAGEPKTMADWQGKTVLLNLWATWCAPCRAEMPALDRLQAEMGDDQFEVVPVSVDLGSDAKPKKFFSDIGNKHMRFFHDGDLAPLNILKKDGLAFGLPATILIDTKGCLRGVLNGPAEWASDEAKALIKAAQ